MAVDSTVNYKRHISCPSDCGGDSGCIDTCSVCLEPMEPDRVGHEAVVQCMPDTCGHLFHKSCVVKWLQRDPTCPLCRKDGFTSVQVLKDGSIEGIHCSDFKTDDTIAYVKRLTTWSVATLAFKFFHIPTFYAVSLGSIIAGVVGIKAFDYCDYRADILLIIGGIFATVVLNCFHIHLNCFHIHRSGAVAVNSLITAAALIAIGYSN